MTPLWRHFALCRALPPAERMATFFPESGEGQDVHTANARAKALCARCPVIEACAEAGEREHFGTWGGITAGERQRGRRARWKRRAS